MRVPASVGRGAVFLATLLVGVVFAAAAQAAPGDLDPSFSGDGKQTTDFGASDSAGGVAIQPNGKIVAVGFAGLGKDFGLARYNPNGLLDPAFSGDGKQTTNFGGDPESGGDGAVAVALDPNGKIVVVGRGGPGADFALARYNPTGSLDPNFSGDGKQTTNFGPRSDVATSVAIQPNGKIVVAGYNGVTFTLARYNSNGSLDPSFSGDGKQTTNFGQYNDMASGVAIQPNGKIVAVGFNGGLSGADFALARYNPNGLLDPSFSGDGKQTTDFGGASDGASGVALQGDGKIVAVGCACHDSGDFALARYNPNGSPDPSFSGDGKQTTDLFGAGDRATGMALQGDKIVAVGGGGGDFGLARYLGG